MKVTTGFMQHEMSRQSLELLFCPEEWEIKTSNNKEWSLFYISFLDR